MANRRKIFVCSAGFGEGHNTAARNLCTALNEIGGDRVDAEFFDVLGQCRPRAYEKLRRGYVTVMNRAPWLWSAMYRVFDSNGPSGPFMALLAPERREFERRLAEDRPVAVVSAYPMYGYLLDHIARHGGPKDFLRVTVVTDSISINSIWHRCGSDYYCVPNEETAEVMRQAGVASDKLRVLGFPVEPRFADAGAMPERPEVDGPEGRRVLYMINAGRRAAPETVKRLLALDVALTITVGRDQEMKATVERLITERRPRPRPVKIIGWTREVPELMIVSQIAPGQEEGNAQLLVQNNAGRLGLDPGQIAGAVEEAFADGSRVYREWSANIAKLSRPDAARDNARFILERAFAVPTP